MPCWLTIYARSSADALTPAKLLDELGHADLDTLAEVHDIEEDLEDDIFERILFVDAQLDGAELHYREPGMRPILFHHWTGRERVAEEVAEAIERGEDAIPDEVRAVLSET